MTMSDIYSPENIARSRSRAAHFRELVAEGTIDESWLITADEVEAYADEREAEAARRLVTQQTTLKQSIHPISMREEADRARADLKSCVDQGCGPCATVREREAERCRMLRVEQKVREEQIARDKYESFLRAHASDAVEVAIHAARAGRSDKNEPVAGSVGNVSLTVAVEFDVDPVALSDSGLDIADAAVDVLQPEHVGALRVKIKNGSVVVELHSHGAEPSANEEIAQSSPLRSEPGVGTRRSQQTAR